MIKGRDSRDEIATELRPKSITKVDTYNQFSIEIQTLNATSNACLK